MPLENLTGKWLGQYTYGESYGGDMAGKSIPFVIEIQDRGHKISGLCIDDETKHLINEPATIEGSFDNNYISFIKKYPCRIITDHNLEIKAESKAPSFQIHYTGTLHKRLFSKNYIFRGQWELTCPFQDEMGEVFYHTFEGSWSMKLEQ